MKKFLILTVFGFCILTVAITFFFVNKISKEFKMSDPYKLVIIELNKVDSLKLQDGYSVNPLIGGTLTPNSANFNIKIKTSKGKFEIYADLTKNDYWEIKELHVRKR
jgi:hypothetical protein